MANPYKDNILIIDKDSPLTRGISTPEVRNAIRKRSPILKPFLAAISVVQDPNNRNIHNVYIADFGTEAFVKKTMANNAALSGPGYLGSWELVHFFPHALPRGRYTDIKNVVEKWFKVYFNQYYKIIHLNSRYTYNPSLYNETLRFNSMGAGTNYSKYWNDLYVNNSYKAIVADYEKLFVS